MIAAIVGIFLAFLVIILVVLVAERKGVPAVSVALEQELTTQGFKAMDRFDPVIEPIIRVCKPTADAVYVEQAFRRDADQEWFFWIQTKARRTARCVNHLLAAFPSPNNIGKWVLLFLPEMTGLGSTAVRKTFELSLKSSCYTKIENRAEHPLALQYDLFVYENTPLPLLNSVPINKLPQCRNVLLRSAGNIIAVERISTDRNEIVANEVDNLLHVARFIKGTL